MSKTDFSMLSAEEATEVLDNFLREARAGFESLRPQLESASVAADYTLGSCPETFAWFSERMVALPTDSDPAVPEWIRKHSSYKESLFEFDNTSKVMLLRFAYYFGESFCRACPQLRWAVGMKDFAQENKPVVAGFEHGMELEVMRVANVMFGKVVKRTGTAAETVSKAIEAWRKSIPSE
jgi:hypothetical protein